MKLPPPLRCGLLAALLFAGGCVKREEEPAFEDTPAQPVSGEASAEERREGAGASAPSAEGTGGGASAGPAAEPAGVPGAVPVPKPVPGESAEGADGIPAKLMASDRAYEEWFKRHGLDLGDPQMLDQDPDGDGFSNRDEFLADTDPRDGKSRPGIHRGLRLKEYREVRVPLLLEEVKGEQARIRLLDEEEGKPRTVAVGQEILGMRVEKVVYETDSDKNGQPVDRSWVELLDAEKKGRVVLVKDMSARSEASHAVLVSAEGGELVVRQGETFEWPAQSGARYRVVDLRAQQAVVRELEGGRMWTIPVQ